VRTEILKYTQDKKRKEEEFVGDKYMIFAEDAPWKAYVYAAF